MMATEVAPSSVAELTDLGKCLMKHEVGRGDREYLSSWFRFHFLALGRCSQ